MILKQLSLKNVGRYSEETIVFNPKTISLIMGENGAGKSTIFEAILWVIFGKTAKEITKDEIVRLGEHSGEVTLWLEDSSHTYTIRRTRDVKSQSTTLNLWIDEKDYTAATIADTESKIQEYLKTDFVTFRNSIFFGQEEVSNFVSGTDKERKDILTKFLELSIYDRALAKVKEEKSSLNQKILTLESSKNQMSSQLGTITQVEQTIKETEQNLSTLQTQQSEELANLEKIKSEYTEELAQEQLKVVNLNTLRTSRDKINTLYYDVREKMNELQRYRVELDKVKENIKQNVTGSCPSCRQDITLESQDNVRRQIIREGNAKKREVDQIFVNLGIPQVSNFEELAQFLMKLNQEIEASPPCEQRCSVLQEKLNQCNPELVKQKYQPQIDSLSSFITTQKKYLQDMSSYKETILRYTQDIENYKKSIGVYESLETAFGPNGIKTLVIENVISSLEEKINHYINSLTLGITVSLETQVQTKSKTIREKFAIFVHDTSGKREFRTYSGGEKRIISVAIRFAFAELALERANSNLQFLLLDEVTDAFDDTRKETFYNLLTTLSERYNQILVISHDSSFRDLFDSSLYVSKNSAGISSIREN